MKGSNQIVAQNEEFRERHNGRIETADSADFTARATSISKSIREERATRKNSQLAAAQRVAMKMGRRPRCSSVTYRLDMRPLTASPARTALPAAHFERNEAQGI